jgi:hypothetical protein
MYRSGRVAAASLTSIGDTDIDFSAEMSLDLLQHSIHLCRFRYLTFESLSLYTEPLGKLFSNVGCILRRVSHGNVSSASSECFTDSISDPSTSSRNQNEFVLEFDRDGHRLALNLVQKRKYLMIRKRSDLLPPIPVF